MGASASEQLGTRSQHDVIAAGRRPAHSGYVCCARSRARVPNVPKTPEVLIRQGLLDAPVLGWLGAIRLRVQFGPTGTGRGLCFAFMRCTHPLIAARSAASSSGSGTG